MSDSSNQDLNEMEPKASQAPVPVLFFVIFVVLVYLSTMYLHNNAGGFNAKVYEPYGSYDVVKAVQPKGNADPRFEKGRVAYVTYCAPCHQNSGKGAPGQFPPLAGSDWVNTEGPNRIIRLIMNGLGGPITVSGVAWNPPAQMPPWKDVITDDEDMACLITYIRGESEWGNSGGPVTAEQVKAVRDEVSSRPIPWTESELFETSEQ